MNVKQFAGDKILKHLTKVVAWLHGANPLPITMEIDINNSCNHNCQACIGAFDGAPHDTEKFSLREADIILPQLNRQICGITFTGGGEPLLNPEAIKIIKLAGEMSFDIGLISNGEFLTEEKACDLLNSCVWIRISLDAASRELYAKRHGTREENFDKVLQNISNLIKIKKIIKSQCTIGIGYLTDIDSIINNDIEKAAELANWLGADYIQYRPLHINNIKEYLNQDVVYKKILQLAKKHSIVLFSAPKYENINERNFGRNYDLCYGHQFASVIGADKKMYLCCHMRANQRYCLGDLKKDTFFDIWNSDQRKKVIQNINFEDCIALCRCNPFNQILWAIKQPREHVNFL